MKNKADHEMAAEWAVKVSQIKDAFGTDLGNHQQENLAAAYLEKCAECEALKEIRWMYEDLCE